MGNAKGTRRERELRTKLDEYGWTIMRAPSSGGGSTDDLPDIFAGDGERRIWAIEVKTSKPQNAIYLSADEVAALERFAEGFHPVVRPVVAVRWDRDTTWYLRNPRSMYRTDSGSRRARHETCRGSWQRLCDIAESE